MKFQRDDIFTGLFVVIGGLLSVATIVVILGLNLLDDREEYVLRIEKLAGVKKGTAIKIKNYTVGEVNEVIPIYGSDLYFKAIVHIDPDLVLYRGTRVNITNQNVIGDTVIDIYPSEKKEQRLQPGDTLFATNIVNLDQMVTQISGVIDSVSKMVSVFGDLAGESKNDVRFLLANLNRSIARVNNMLRLSEGEIIATMRNIRLTSQTLEKFSRQIAANPWMLLEKKGGGSSGGSGTKALP